MFKKKLFILSSLFVVLLATYSISFAESKTTTVDETTTETTVPAKNKRTKPVTTVTSTSSTTTTQVQPRKVLDEDTLKKISNTLCTEGFKASVGGDKKNVCQSRASSPDIAYSCIWNKKGAAAYAPSKQGPCTLDFAEHKGSIIITKEDYASNPPLSYGTEVQCCFRAAKDSAVSNQ